MKTVIYARVSTDDQRPEIQIEELQKFCTARGWDVVKVITDHGYSGSTDNRPGFKDLISLAKSRQIDAIVVTKLDRLFRSLKHLVGVLEELQALGVVFVATKDSVDYSTPSGRMFAQLLGIMAEFERALLIERTKAGLHYAKSIGKVLGRPRTVDDAAILELRSAGKSYSEIRKQLHVSSPSIRRAITKAK